MKNAVAFFLARLFLLLLVSGPLGAQSHEALNVCHSASFSLPESPRIALPDNSEWQWIVTSPFDRQHENQILPVRAVEIEEDENENESSNSDLAAPAASSAITGFICDVYAATCQKGEISSGYRSAFLTTPWYIVIQVFRI